MRGFHTLLISILLTFSGFAPSSAQTPEKVDTLSASIIIANRDRALLSGLTSYDSGQLHTGASVLGVADIVRTLKMLPGVAAGMEITSGLYVHGGDGSDNLFLLDGVPLFQVAHLGGMFSSFNTEAIRSLDFYKSGFPARYGGRLSSVVDIATKDGDFQDYHGSASLGLLDGQVSVGGPVVKDRLAMQVALRRSWPDVVVTPVLAIRNANNRKKTTGTYYLYDMNLSLNWMLRPTDMISLHLYRGKDHLRYATSTVEKFYGKEIYEEESFTKLKMDWGNLAVSSTWRHTFSDLAPLQLRVYYSRGFSDIGYETREARMRGDSPVVDAFGGQDAGDVACLGAEVRQMFYGDHHRLELGADFQRFRFLFPDSAVASGNGGVYLEDKITYGPFHLLAGLRLDAYCYESGLLFKPQPRVAVSYTAGSRLTLNASYTQTVQFTHLLSAILLDLPTNRWGPSSANLPPAEARQFTLGWECKLLQNLSVRGEAYYKDMQNLVMYIGATTLFPPADNRGRDFASGRGRAYGLDVEGQFWTERSETVLNYSLSWSRRLFPDVFQDWFYDRYDNRHNIAIRHTHRLGRKVKLIISWGFHSGNRITFPEQILGEGRGMKFLYSSPNNMRMPAWHCLDLGCEYRQETRKGREGRWTFGLYNVYGRQNPVVMFLADKIENPGYFYLRSYSLPPLIPSVSYTYTF